MKAAKPLPLNKMVRDMSVPPLPTTIFLFDDRHKAMAMFLLNFAGLEPSPEQLPDIHCERFSADKSDPIGCPARHVCRAM
jgi:hypothetical protein